MLLGSRCLHLTVQCRRGGEPKGYPLQLIWLPSGDKSFLFGAPGTLWMPLSLIFSIISELVQYDLGKIVLTSKATLNWNE